MPILPISGAATMRGAIVPLGTGQVSGNGTYSITFSNIPQNCQDLMLVVNARNVGNFNGYGVYVNCNDNTSLYSFTYLNTTFLSGTGTSRATSQGDAAIGQTYDSELNDNYCYSITHINNYANTSYFKTFLNQSSDSSGWNMFAGMYANLWRSTAAITTLNIHIGGTNLGDGSNATLYGIRTVGQ